VTLLDCTKLLLVDSPIPSRCLFCARREADKNQHGPYGGLAAAHRFMAAE
jgi:hypothetical protein